jgi:capsid protein
MALLNEFGTPYVQHKAARSAERHSGQRPWEPVELRNIDKLIPSYDRKTLLSASRRMYINIGVARGAIDQKAMYSVGRAWQPDFLGTDTDFGTEAKDWLVNQWYGIGDVRGGMHDFVTSLFLLSVAIDRDGEAFILLTQTADGYPRYQHIPAHRVSGDTYGNGQKMRGGTLRDGVVYNDQGAPLWYRVVSDETPETETWVAASNMIHLYDPQWQEQGRGLPAFTHALNDLRDMAQSHEWERMAQMMLSSIGLVEYNDKGGPDLDDPYNELTGVCETGKGMVVEKLDGGSVRYFRSNSGGKIETIKSDRPGEVWENFQDRIIRSSLAGINWPYSMSWKATGQGTAERSDLGKAQRAVEDRQDILEYAAKRMVSYAVAKQQKRGELSESGDWWRWAFSKPAKLTIDDGRVMRELTESYKMGFRSGADITQAMGKEYKDVIRAKAEEAAMRQMMIKEMQDKYDVEIDPRELVMFTSNEQPQTDDDETTGNQQPNR